MMVVVIAVLLNTGVHCWPFLCIQGNYCFWQAGQGKSVLMLSYWLFIIMWLLQPIFKI